MSEQNFFDKIKNDFAQGQEEWKFSASSIMVTRDAQKNEAEAEANFEAIRTSAPEVNCDALPVQRTDVSCTVCFTKGKEKINITHLHFPLCPHEISFDKKNACFYYDSTVKSITITGIVETHNTNIAAIIKTYNIRSKS
ncbi:hypothetical protein H0R96_13285 [Treponema socranskii]